MKNIVKCVDNCLRALYRMLLPLFNPVGLMVSLFNYPRYFLDLIKYKTLGGEHISLFDLQPILNNRSEKTELDYHYYYQALWLFEKVYRSRVKVHHDIASDSVLVGIISKVAKVVFVDIRPLPINVSNFEQIRGDAMNLSFGSGSIESLSCCHVIEHIGLGRYGDKVDPLGSQKAANELGRVLANGGNLYISVPVGRPKVMFNAHRIFHPKKVKKMFAGLKLKEFMMVTDRGDFVSGDDNLALKQNYGLGLYHFLKE